VDARGDKVGLVRSRETTHHFLPSAAEVDRVTANGGEDEESRDAIRGHLAHIAKMFSDGDFGRRCWSDRVPPGVDAMKKQSRHPVEVRGDPERRRIVA
jgi:hypothetical protein